MISKVNLRAKQIIWVFMPNENFVVYGKKEKNWRVCLKNEIKTVDESIKNINNHWLYMIFGDSSPLMIV